MSRCRNTKMDQHRLQAHLRNNRKSGVFHGDRRNKRARTRAADKARQINSF